MPISRALSAEAAEHLLFGVPLHWMQDWSTPFSLYVKEARGATFTDVDGHRYVDFCLGDTGAMFGHAPEPVARAPVPYSSGVYVYSAAHIPNRKNCIARPVPISSAMLPPYSALCP
ncbi:aminotransferase [Burkholderia sp. TJI49]|nr:aminotransferase [Burkholderia sp. TJI49]